MWNIHDRVQIIPDDIDIHISILIFHYFIFVSSIASSLIADLPDSFVYVSPIGSVELLLISPWSRIADIIYKNILLLERYIDVL